jgi:hypothetical protein
VIVYVIYIWWRKWEKKKGERKEKTGEEARDRWRGQILVPVGNPTQ